jgi:DNA-binding beta-propeller fold protein YncE
MSDETGTGVVTVATTIPTRTATLYKYGTTGRNALWYTMMTFTGTEGDFIRKYAEGWTTRTPEEMAADVARGS